jgi:uncharacterized protein YPO0396
VGERRGGREHAAHRRHRVGIETLEKQRRDFVARIQDVGARYAAVQKAESNLVERIGQLQQVTAYESFREIEWRPIAIAIDELRGELESREAQSDKLRVLAEKLREIEAALDALDGELSEVRGEIGAVREKHDNATKARLDCDSVLDAATQAGVDAAALDRIEPTVVEALSGRELTVESCDSPRKRAGAHRCAPEDSRDRAVRGQRWLRSQRGGSALDDPEPDDRGVPRRASRTDRVSQWAGRRRRISGIK